MTFAGLYTARDFGVSDAQVAMLRELIEAGGSMPRCLLEQAIYTKLERRGFVSYGRKRAVVITQQGRNVASGSTQ